MKNNLNLYHFLQLMPNLYVGFTSQNRNISQRLTVHHVYRDGCSPVSPPFLSHLLSLVIFIFCSIGRAL